MNKKTFFTIAGVALLAIPMGLATAFAYNGGYHNNSRNDYGNNSGYHNGNCGGNGHNNHRNRGASYNNNRHNGMTRTAMIEVDSATYQQLQDAEVVFSQLNSSLENGTEATINSRATALLSLVGKIKSPALQEHTTALSSELQALKQAKGVSAKRAYGNAVRYTMHTILMNTAEKSL